jgi:hypothetical protein
MDHAQKPPWKVRLIVLAAVFLVALYGLDRLILFMRTPFAGIYGEFRSNGFYVQSLAGGESPSLVKPGACIISVEGVPVEEWLRALLHIPQKAVPGWSLEKSLRIGVTGESNAPETVLLVLRSPEWKDFFGNPFRLWILAIFILFCGAYLQFHYSDQQRVQILSILLLAAALSIFNYSGKHLLIQLGAHLPWMLIIRLGTLCVISSSWLYLILIFLERRNHLRFPSWVPWMIYGFPPALTVAVILSTRAHPLSIIEFSSRTLYLIAGGTVIFTFWILTGAYRSTADAVLKAQLKWILWGHVLGMSPNDKFDDIEEAGFAGFINRMNELGITGGCGGRNYCPSASTSRAMMAVFLVTAF